MQNLTITDVRVLPGDAGFLIDDGRTAILYDSGFAFTGYGLAENIKKVLGHRELNYIFLTHSHYDHALGAAYVSKVYPGAKIVAGEYAAKIFAKPTARSVMRQMDQKAAASQGIADYEDLIDDLRVDIAVSDGDKLTCGDLVFTVVALPGHTKCSVGFYLEKEGLLLGTETLGVYFGQDTYLPSYLVGYQMALDSIYRAKQLAPKAILLPHYGLVNREQAEKYLAAGEAVAKETAQTILEQLRVGHTREEIAEHLEKVQYKENVARSYPLDAYRLNTSIMIGLIEKELFTEETKC